MRKRVLVIVALTFVLVGAVAALVAREVAQAKRDYAIWEAVSSPTPIAVIDFDPNKPVADRTETRGFSIRRVGGIIDDLRDMFPSGRPTEKNYPLIIAARDGAPETVQRLIDAGADIEAMGDFGTPLMYAMGSDLLRTPHALSVDKVQILIRAGANVCVRNYFDFSVLMTVLIAAKHDGSQTFNAAPYLQYVVNHAWNDCLLKPDCNGSVPLMILTNAGVSCDLIEELLRKGDDARAVTIYGTSSLFHISYMSPDYICVIRTLIAHGADPGASSKYGGNALDFARHLEAPQDAIELLEAAMRGAASAH